MSTAASKPHGNTKHLDPLTPEQQELAATGYHHAQIVARRFGRQYPWLAEEFASEVGEAICGLAARYDPTRGEKFSTFISRRVVGACLDVIRRDAPNGLSRYGKPVIKARSIESPVGWSNRLADSPDELRIIDTLADDADPVGWQMESEEFVRDLCRRLPGRCGEAVARLYLHADCVTMKGAGRAVGLSESRVSQIVSELPTFLATA